MSGCSSEVYQRPRSEGGLGLFFSRGLLPRFDARGWQNAALFGMLMALQIAGAVFTPLNDADTDSIWGLTATVAIGSCLAPPALLALWAVFGPEAVIVRLPLTMWLAAVYYVVFLFAAVQETGAADGMASLFLGFVWLAFFCLQAPLWLLRAVRRWRFVAAGTFTAVAADGGHRKRANQFTIRALLGWTLAAAVPLAAFRALVAESSFDADDLYESLPEIAFAGSLVALAGLSIVPLAWIFLAAGRRPVLRLVLSLILVVGVCGGSWLFVELSGGPGFAEIIPILVGTMANGFVSLTVVGGCGYRLVREPRYRRSECAAPLEAAERKPLSRVRFAIALAPLAALSVAVLCAVPYQLRQWRQAAVVADWAGSGVTVSFDDSGKLTNVNCIEPQVVSDGLLKRIAGLNGLEYLNLTGASIGARQLALLAPLTNLRSLLLGDCQITDQELPQLAPFQKLEFLDLTNTRVTDAGLTSLKALPRLSRLHLQLTDVTDDCLTTFASLPAMSGLNVSLTAVTRAAAEQFGAAHPGLSFDYGASDALLAQLLINQSVTHVSGGYSMTVQPKRVKRLRAQGNYLLPGGALVTVTDTGLRTLAEHTELEELDLHDTGITDQGLLKLNKLTALTRLDVRGTQVTEQGIADLAQSLPGCEILR